MMAKAELESDASDRKMNSRLAHACARAKEANRTEGQKRQRSANKMKLRGGRGFNSFGEAVQQPHLPSRADFFLGPKNLIFFKNNQVFQTCARRFLRQNKARTAGRPLDLTIYFHSLQRDQFPKNVAKFPGGGVP